MSLFYTHTRLWWNGRRGQAQCDGVYRDLATKPDLPFEMYTMDYAPELDTLEICHRPCDARDDLTPPEIVAVKSWLASFAASIKRRF